MSMTLNSDFRVDRVPAVAIPPLEPIIQGTVISHARPVKEVSGEAATFFDLRDNKPIPQQTYQSYNIHAQQMDAGVQSGTALNIYV